MQLKYIAAIIAGVMMSGSAAHAQDWPTRPITLVVPFTAGGAIDTAVRPLAQRLSERFNQPVVVENRDGAGGAIGTLDAVRADPDGYTLVVGTPANMVNITFLAENAGEEPLFSPREDLRAIAQVYQGSNVLLIRSGIEVDNLEDLISLANANPHSLSVAAPGLGGTQHLNAVLFERTLELPVTMVPYRGNAQAVTDLLAGHVDMIFDSPANALQHIEQGTMVPIAVTSVDRMAELPDVPSFTELGYPAMQVFTFVLLAGPAGLPEDLVQLLNRAVIEEMAGTDGRPSITPPGRVTEPLTSEELEAFLDRETERWGPILTELNIGGE